MCGSDWLEEGRWIMGRAFSAGGIFTKRPGVETPGCHGMRRWRCGKAGAAAKLALRQSWRCGKAGAAAKLALRKLALRQSWRGLLPPSMMVWRSREIGEFMATRRGEKFE